MSNDQRAAERPSFYTASETAEILRLDESTLYRHLRNGTFPGLKIGGRYVVPGAVLDRLIADVLVTGRCVDLGGWTEQWRHEQIAALARVTAGNVEIPGGVA
ncbi:helix-turn-helix domain-containing protein [Pseudonocardia sichuanensis]